MDTKLINFIIQSIDGRSYNAVTFHTHSSEKCELVHFGSQRLNIVIHFQLISAKISMTLENFTCRHLVLRIYGMLCGKSLKYNEMLLYIAEMLTIFSHKAGMKLLHR